MCVCMCVKAYFKLPQKCHILLHWYFTRVLYLVKCALTHIYHFRIFVTTYYYFTHLWVFLWTCQNFIILKCDSVCDRCGWQVWCKKKNHLLYAFIIVSYWDTLHKYAKTNTKPCQCIISTNVVQHMDSCRAL